MESSKGFFRGSMEFRMSPKILWRRDLDLRNSTGNTEHTRHQEVSKEDFGCFHSRLEGNSETLI